MIYDPTRYVPLSAEVFQFLIASLGSIGLEDIDWSESIVAPAHADEFATNVINVICNSGMKHTVAAGIYTRCMKALAAGHDVRSVFKHPGKSAAIAHVWDQREALFDQYRAAPDQLAFLASLPWVGKVTKYHLGKLLGMDIAKPDVHLQRLADRDGSTAQALCARLAQQTGYRVATVDAILWRACATGILNSRTGLIPSIDHLNLMQSLMQAASGDAALPTIPGDA